MYYEYMYSSYSLKAFLTAGWLAVLSSTAMGKQTHLDIKVPQRVENDLFGPVKSVSTDTTYNMSEQHIRERTEYDEAGNLTVELNWNRDGELTSTITNFYDESGCFQRQQYINVKNPDDSNDWEIILNPETRQIAMKNERNGEIIIRTYSPEKYLVHFKVMDREKALIRASRTRRGEDNRETEYTRYDGDNRPLYTYYFKWDGRGFVDRERVHYHQEKKDMLYVYDYLQVDEKGNWTQRLLTGYEIEGKEKTKVYDRLTVRTIEYYGDAPEEKAQ